NATLQIRYRRSGESHRARRPARKSSVSRPVSGTAPSGSSGPCLSSWSALGRFAQELAQRKIGLRPLLTAACAVLAAQRSAAVRACFGLARCGSTVAGRGSKESQLNLPQNVPLAQGRSRGGLGRPAGSLILANRCDYAKDE